VVAQRAPAPAKKFGQGLVFALVLFATIGLLGLANAARKQKVQAASQAAAKASAGAPVTVATATSVPQAPPMQAPAGKPASHTPETATSFKSTAEVVIHKSAEIAAPKLTKASLAVTSDPLGADIFVDGIATGQTTPAEITVDPGQHKVALQKPGYRVAEMLTDAGAGQTLNVAPVLEAQGDMVGRQKTRFAAWRTFEQTGQLPAGKGGLQIRTNPPGAQITINDIPVPRATPFRFPVAPGTYRVRLSMDGYYAITKIVEVDAGSMTQVNEKLQGK
jgi:hypothetical protein